MTFKKANNMIDDISWFYGGESITTDDIVECREVCHEALGKQIPKEIKRRVITSGITLYHCPVCNEHYYQINLNFCQHCGQALDWSDTE